MNLRFKKLLVMMLVLLSMSTSFTKASADWTYKYKYVFKNAEVKKLEEGNQETIISTDRENETWTKQCTIYIVTVPADGYLTFIDYTETHNTPYWLFDTKTDAKNMTNFHDVWHGQKTARTPVAKGTYYVRMNAGYYKFKYTFTAVNCLTLNLCKPLATPLEAEKTELICIPREYDYDRWYKINVDTKHRLLITVNDLMTTPEEAEDHPTVRLRNNKGTYFDLYQASGFKYKTVKVLPAGTYYLIVSANHCTSTSYDLFGLYKLSWK